MVSIKTIAVYHPVIILKVSALLGKSIPDFDFNFVDLFLFYLYSLTKIVIILFYVLPYFFFVLSIVL